MKKRPVIPPLDAAPESVRASVARSKFASRGSWARAIVVSLADSDRVELRSVVAKRLARTDPVTAFLVEKERVAPGAILVLTRVDGEPELRVLSLEVPIDEPAPPIEWDYEVEVEG